MKETVGIVPVSDIGVAPETHYLRLTKQRRTWFQLRERAFCGVLRDHSGTLGLFIEPDYPANPYPGDYTLLHATEMNEEVGAKLSAVRQTLQRHDLFDESALSLIQSYKQKIIGMKSKDLFNPVVAQMITRHEEAHRVQHVRTDRQMPDLNTFSGYPASLRLFDENPGLQRDIHNWFEKWNIYAEAQAMAAEFTWAHEKNPAALEKYTLLYATKLLYLFMIIPGARRTQLNDTARQLRGGWWIDFSNIYDATHALGLALVLFHDPNLVENLENGALSAAELDAKMKVMLFDLLENPSFFIEHIKQPSFIIGLDQKLLNCARELRKTADAIEATGVNYENG